MPQTTTAPPPPSLDDVAHAWATVWGDAPPVPAHVAEVYPDRRIRLDGSHDTGLHEPFHVVRTEARRRVQSVLDELRAGDAGPLVGLWIDQEPPDHGEWTRLRGLVGRRLSCAFSDHVHAAPALGREEVADLVRLTVAGSLGMLLLGPPSLEWLVHPFEDGVEVLVSAPERREELLGVWSSWLCLHTPWFEEGTAGRPMD